MGKMTDEATTVHVETAGNVNVPGPVGVPHVRVLVGVTFFVLIGFAGVSWHVLSTSDDGTIVGAIIGTWTALATSAGGFWLGASSGGKMRQ